MNTVEIILNSVEKVKSFVKVISKFNADFDLTCGRAVIDAKSIVGVMSLDLSKPLDLEINPKKSDVNEIIEALEPYMAA
ncbi:PTS HPr component phosphorylation site [Lachnospiraceae bacterium KH1T2]|nr:PTS HPr component phosphorylation site [Lachnospiraceae bacterium KH1T2]